jgi:hypothetical protein
MATRKTTIPEDKQPEAVKTIAALYTKSVERLAEAQKKTLDITLQQNADLIGAWKKIAHATPGIPVPGILDFAGNTFAQFVDLQKGAIDLALEQSEALAGLASERSSYIQSTTESVKSMVQDTLQRTASTQKGAIEFSAKQTKAVIDTFKKQPGVAGSPAEVAVDSFQRGFDSLIETQKELLNIASKRTA